MNQKIRRKKYKDLTRAERGMFYVSMASFVLLILAFSFYVMRTISIFLFLFMDLLACG